MEAETRRWSHTDRVVFGLLAACVVRLWLMVMPSSLWTDEMVTAFVINRPHDPSFAVAPQVTESLYYWLPKISSRLLGMSEITLRVPSVLAMIVALYFIGRLAERLIHPDGKWLAVALCLCLVEFDFFAIDARPYAMGIAIGAASLHFLVGWMDEGRWADALLFIGLAALLWRVHLFNWPFYLLYAGYAVARLASGAAKARIAQVLVAVISVSALLAPVVARALEISAGAQAHVFNGPPGPIEFLAVAEITQVVIVLVVALVVRLTCRWKRESPKAEGASAGLILGWWLICPVCLTAYSWITHNGVLIPRYVSLMIPGVALTAALVVTRLVPRRHWKRAAATAAFVALAALGQWWQFWPIHVDEQWREAAQFERQVASETTPVLSPSPFIEAQPPVWTPGYHLPGFLYSNLSYYPMRGQASVFPFSESRQGDTATVQLMRTRLIPARRFIIFGPIMGVDYLQRRLQLQPELIGWHSQAYRFGIVYVVVYSAGPIPVR